LGTLVKKTADPYNRGVRASREFMIYPQELAELVTYGKGIWLGIGDMFFSFCFHEFHNSFPLASVSPGVLCAQDSNERFIV
jgi:hypothetical protein